MTSFTGSIMINVLIDIGAVLAIKRKSLHVNTTTNKNISKRIFKANCPLTKKSSDDKVQSLYKIQY